MGGRDTTQRELATGYNSGDTARTRRTEATARAAVWDFSIPHVPLCFNMVIGTLGRCNGNAVVLSHKDDVN